MNGFKVRKTSAVRHIFNVKKCQCLSCVSKEKLWQQITEIKNLTDHVEKWIDYLKNLPKVHFLIVENDENNNNVVAENYDCKAELVENFDNEDTDPELVIDESDEQCESKPKTTETSDNLAKLQQLIDKFKQMGFNDTSDALILILMAFLRSTDSDVELTLKLITETTDHLTKLQQLINKFKQMGFNQTFDASLWILMAFLRFNDWDVELSWRLIINEIHNIGKIKALK